MATKVSAEELRRRELKAIVNSGLIKKNISKNALAKLLDVSVTSLYVRLADPDTFRLEELRNLVWVLKLSDEEALKFVK